MTFQAGRVFVVCFLGLLAGCASTNFVPDNGWPDNEWRAEFYENWFGKQLAAAGELPMVEGADLSGSVSRFRLLVLPSFSPASVYRIDERQSGKFILTRTVLNGAGGYDPGEVDTKAKRELTDIETANLAQLIERAQLSAAQIDASGRFETDDDGNELIIVCTDGTRIVIERLTETDSQFLTRHECDLKRYPKLSELYGFVADLEINE